MKRVPDRESVFARQAANHVPLTPLSFLERTAEVHPERIAVRYGSLSQTYGELVHRCRRLASGLRNAGVAYGDVVSILAPNTPAHLEAHFGIPMAGAIIHSINTRLDAPTIAYMLRHGRSRLLLVDDELLKLARQAVALLEIPVPIIRIADAAIDPLPGDETRYEDFLMAAPSSSPPDAITDEWDTLALNYTSGTTGNPKGVLYHHRGGYLNAIGNTLAWSMDRNPVYLWTLPMFHCNGWCFPWTITALAGTHVCLRNVDGASIARAIVEESVTHLCGAPIILARAIDPPRDLADRIPHGVKVMVAGAPPASAVIERAEGMGFDVTQTYGLTEVYGPCVVSEWKAEWDDLPPADRAVRKARQGVRYHLQDGVDVLDPHTLAPVARDGAVLGEVMIRGNIAMKGYLDDPAATELAFAGGWFHTGDLAVRHLDGYIELKDRSKDIIISGGENISTIEVESVLFEHPAVSEAAVVAMPDPVWGEVPCAFVTLKPDQEADSQAIIAFCRTKLARFKAPRRVIFGELPKTATGKVQKYVLRENARAVEPMNEFQPVSPKEPPD